MTFFYYPNFVYIPSCMSQIDSCCIGASTCVRAAGSQFPALFLSAAFLPVYGKIRKKEYVFKEDAMDISEEISKMNFYKTFEPYIDPSVTMEERMKGNVRLTKDAPEEAKQALAKWKAMKLKSRIF